MRHTTTRSFPPLGAALAAFGVAAAAEVQQNYAARQDRPEPSGAPQRDMSRQPEGQQGFDAESIDTSNLVVIGMDLDNDGRADITYLVPGAAARQFARD